MFSDQHFPYRSGKSDGCGWWCLGEVGIPNLIKFFASQVYTMVKLDKSIKLINLYMHIHTHFNEYKSHINRNS